MGEETMFTDALNFKLLATELRRSGYTLVPDRATLIESAKKAGKVAMVQWVLDLLERNEGDFMGRMAFNLAEVGDV